MNNYMKNESKKSVRFIKTFFIVMGLIFTVLLIIIASIIAFIAITKPLGINVTNIPAVITGTSDVTTSSYDHPALNTQQEVFLESLGVDTATLPSSITPAMEACAVGKLGQQRVDDIKAGSQLTTSDYLKAGSCF